MPSNWQNTNLKCDQPIIHCYACVDGLVHMATCMHLVETNHMVVALRSACHRPVYEHKEEEEEERKSCFLLFCPRNEIVSHGSQKQGNLANSVIIAAKIANIAFKRSKHIFGQHSKDIIYVHQ